MGFLTTTRQAFKGGYTMTNKEYADPHKLYAIRFPDGSSEIVMKVTTDRKGFKGYVI